MPIFVANGQYEQKITYKKLRGGGGGAEGQKAEKHVPHMRRTV